MLYAGDGLGLQSSTVRRFLFHLKSYLKVSLLVIYVFWFVLASLFQILFHYIPLSIERMNIIIILYILLCVLMMINYSVSADLRSYAIESNLAFKQKKRLILMNEYLGVVLTWGFIFLFSLPFFIMQTILNGITGFSFMGQSLIGLLYMGFIIGFVKFVVFVFSDRYTVGIHRLLMPIFYICICLVLSLYQTYLYSFLSALFHNILNEGLAKSITNLEVLSEFNLYEYKINLISYVFVFIVIFVCSSLLYFFSEKLCIEKERPSHFMDYSFLKKHSLYIFLNFSRAYGIVNTDFLLVYIGTLFVLMFSSLIGVQMVDISYFSAYILVVLFLNYDTVRVILLCKRHSTTTFYTAFMLSFPLLVQFTLMIGIFFLTKTVQFDTTALRFFLLGSVLIICSMYLYCRCIYRFEVLFDEKFFKKIGKLYIIIFFLIIAGVQFLLHGFGLINIVFSYFVPIFCVYGLSIWTVDKIAKIRGFKYD